MNGTNEDTTVVVVVVVVVGVVVQTVCQTVCVFKSGRGGQLRTVDLKGHARPPMPVLQERQLAPIYCPRCSFMLLALTSHCLFFDCLHSPVRLGL